MWKKIGRFILRLWTFTYLLVGMSLVWGCASAMPVTIHPLTDVILEGETPSKEWMGLKWTLQGAYDARLWPAKVAMPVIMKDYERQRERSKGMAETLQALLASSGLLTTGAAPFLLKQVPKGYKKEDEL